MLLFENESSDDEQQPDASEQLQVRRVFEGPGMQKMMALQSRIGSDKRFQLDERFMEDDDIECELPASACVQLHEKQRALQLLSSIIPDAFASRHEETRTTKNYFGQRYDPCSANRKELEISKPNKVETKSLAKGRSSVATNDETTEALSSNKSKFFEVTHSLKDTFEHTEEPFSLFGELPVRSDDSKTVEKLDIEEDVERKATKEPVRKEASHSDKKASVMPEKSPATQLQSQRSTFFVNHRDPKVQESLSFFCQRDKLKSICEGWSERRFQLTQMYRQRHKDALRQSKSQGVSNGKRNRRVSRKSIQHR